MKIIFFDGICIMCNGFVSFINKHDKKKNLFFCDIRSEKAQKILSDNNFQIQSIDTIIFFNNKKLVFKSDAIIEILVTLNGFFKLFLIFKIVPKRWRDYFYNVFAKKRFLFGEKKSCEFNPNLAKKIIF